MDWRDQGALLSVRRHGESAAIAEIFTAAHGRHLGIVHGGASRRMAPVLQPGAQLDVTWRARLEDQLGHFTVEPLASRSAILTDRDALAGLNAVTALLSATLPEREPHPRLYAASLALLDHLGREGWPLAYLRWELALLEDLGHGLDLSRCAVRGGANDLAYISPRTGRAVSRAGAGDWADRLLPFSPALVTREMPERAELLAGLRVTGHFLARLTAQLGDRPPPAARQRLIDRLDRQSPEAAPD